MNDRIDRFRKAVERGTGDAVIIQKNFPDLDFGRAILRGCYRNLSYDPQCEGHRAHYMVSLILGSTKSRTLANSFLRCFIKSDSSGWDLSQQFAIAGELFFRTKDLRFREAIYEKYQSLRLDAYIGVEDEELVRVCGIEGLLLFSRKRGENLLAGRSESEDSYFVDEFKKRHRNIRVDDILERSGREDRNISAYVESIGKNKSKKPRPRKKCVVTYQDIKANIENLRVIPASPRAIRDLPVQSFERLADDFQSEKSREKLEKYLRLFAVRTFPFEPSKILDLAKKRESRNDRLVEFACKSLRYFHDERVRAFAVSRITKKRLPASSLFLLVSNYEIGDSELICSVIERARNYEEVHELCWPIIAIYEHNSGLDCQKPLELLFYRLNCGLHRAQIAKILWNSGKISETMAKDLNHDSYDGVRGVAGGEKPKFNL